MCVTAGPARLSNTILYAAEARESVHVLGYQNVVQNQSGGPNAMILPFPAISGTMTRENVVPTDRCPNLLKDMAKAIMPRSRGPVMLGIQAKGISRVEVFDSGIYTVVLAQDAKDIPAALKQVPTNKRPKIRSEIFEAYSRWYPRWPIALCCFDNRAATAATPMLWWYYALNSRYLFAPALDSHTGDVPDRQAQVNVDHTVVVGSNLIQKDWRVAHRITFSDEPLPQEVQHWVVDRVIGKVFKEEMDNGDFLIPVNQVRAGQFFPARVPPLSPFMSGIYNISATL